MSGISNPGGGISLPWSGNYGISDLGVSYPGSVGISVIELPAPLCSIPFNGTDDVIIGTGSITNNRSTTATYVSHLTGLVTTAAIDEARFERVNGIVRRLIEGPSTNVVIRSEEFDNAAWIKGSDITITPNTTIAPDGALTGDTFSSVGNNRQIDQTFVIADPENRTFTFSVFVDLTGTLTQFELRLRRGDNSDQAIVLHNSTTGIPITGNWRRYDITHTFSSSTTGNDVQAIFIPVFGDTGTAFIFGAQLEELEFASSYTKTVASTVTRTADILTLPTTGNFSESIGTVSANVTYLGSTADITDARMAWQINDGTNANKHQVYNASGNVAGAFGQTASVTQYFGANGVTITDQSSHQLALAYQTNNVRGYYDGAEFFNDAVATMPVVNIINFGRSSTGSGLYGHIDDFRTYDVLLTADQVKAL